MRGIADAIYWKLHASFLRNQREAAQRFLAMLEDEASKASLDDQLSRPQLLRYVAMKGRMAIGEYGRIYGAGAGADGIAAPTKAEPSGSEVDFHRKLMTREGRTALCLALTANLDADFLHELDLSPYGRLDLLVKDGRTWTAVEIKMGEAQPSVISQVDKYRLALELEMNKGLHDEVQAVVLAEAFPEIVKAELARMAVTMVQHDGTLQGIRRIVPK